MNSENSTQERPGNSTVSAPSSPIPSRKRTPKKLGPKSNANDRNQLNNNDEPPLPYRTADTQKTNSQSGLGSDRGSQSRAQTVRQQSQPTTNDQLRQSQGPSENQSRRHRSRGRRRGKGKDFASTDASGSDSQLYHSDLSATQSRSGLQSRKRQPSDAQSAVSSELSEEAPQGGRKNTTARRPPAADMDDEQRVLDTVREIGEPDDASQKLEGASSLGTGGTRKRRNRLGTKGIAKKVEGEDAATKNERREEEKTLKLRLDLDLDLEIELKAVIKGSVTLSLLT